MRILDELDQWLENRGEYARLVLEPIAFEDAAKEAGAQASWTHSGVFKFGRVVVILRDSTFRAAKDPG